MNIDFEKSHPAVNIDDKRRLYVGFVHALMYAVVLLLVLMIGMFLFLT
jgi:hypothetical protein